jgi:hypothetical protein
MIGVLSTQLWHQQFIESALSTNPLLPGHASVLLTDRLAGPDQTGYAFPAHAAART